MRYDGVLKATGRIKSNGRIEVLTESKKHVTNKNGTWKTYKRTD